MTTIELETVVKLKKALLTEVYAHLDLLKPKPYFEVRDRARELERRAAALAAELEDDTAELERVR